MVIEDQQAKMKGEKEFQKWEREHPKTMYDTTDGMFPIKTDEEIAEFKEKWGL